MSAADYWPRVQAAIFEAKANRFEVEYEWPECHKNKCQAHHGNPGSAFGIMAHAIANSVESEMKGRAITRPDVSDYDTEGNPVALATYTLAALLSTYAKDAPTYVKAAQLIIDAYPGMVDLLVAEESIPTSHSSQSEPSTVLPAPSARNTSPDAHTEPKEPTQ